MSFLLSLNIETHINCSYNTGVGLSYQSKTEQLGIVLHLVYYLIV